MTVRLIDTERDMGDYEPNRPCPQSRSLWWVRPLTVGWCLLTVLLFVVAVGQEQAVHNRPATISERLDALEQSVKNERELQHARWAKLNRQVYRILVKMKIDEDGDLEAGDRPIKGVQPPEPNEETTK